MPDRQTLARARADKRQGKAPSTQTFGHTTERGALRRLAVNRMAAVFTSILAMAAVVSMAATFSMAARADEPIPYAQGNALMVRYKCDSCHDAYSTLKAPSLNAIARKYATDPTAQVELETMVVNGSSGVWGTNSGMPPNDVPAADLHRLVEWILSLR